MEQNQGGAIRACGANGGACSRRVGTRGGGSRRWRRGYCGAGCGVSILALLVCGAVLGERLPLPRIFELLKRDGCLLAIVNGRGDANGEEHEV